MKTKYVLPLLALFGSLVVGTSWVTSQPAAMAPPGLWGLSSPTSTGNEQLLMHSGVTPAGATQVILVDVAKRSMAVYAVAADTGVIHLRSVRNLAADFQLEEFNGADPSPSKVRGILTPP